MVVVKKVRSFKKEQKQASRIAASTNEIELPSEPVEPATEFAEFCSVFFGDKGIGKTSLLAQFPDCVVNQLEPGRRHLRIRQVPKKGEQQLDWERLKAYLRLEIEDESVKTIGIDTVDKAYEACFIAKCSEAGVTHPQKLGREGQYLWGDIIGEFSEVMNEVRFSGKTLIFLSHGKHHQIENVLRRCTVEKYSPSCTGQALGYLQSACDFAFCYTRDEGKRVMILQGDENIWASCGPENCFLDKKTRLPIRAISMDGGAEEAYRNLCRGFANQLTEMVLSDSEEQAVDPPELEKKSGKKFILKKKAG